MQATVCRWGNSLALRLPKNITAQAGVQEHDAVELAVVDGNIVATPSRTARYHLDELLDKVKRSNLHAELATGAARGREAW